MRRMIRNDEDYVRSILDLYDEINCFTTSDSVESVIASCDSAISHLERIKVYRLSQAFKDGDSYKIGSGNV